MTHDEAKQLLKTAFERVYAAGFGVQSLVEEGEVILGVEDLEVYEGCDRRGHEPT